MEKTTIIETIIFRNIKIQGNKSREIINNNFYRLSKEFILISVIYYYIKYSKGIQD